MYVYLILIFLNFIILFHLKILFLISGMKQFSKTEILKHLKFQKNILKDQKDFELKRKLHKFKNKLD